MLAVSALDDARARFGITRVAALTALDRVGVPVVSATRADPFAGSISVHAAAALDPAVARLRALAEAVERWCGEPRGQVPVSADPHAPPWVPVVSDPDVPTTAWCAGVRLDTAAPVSVPAWATFLPWPAPWPARPTSNGLAFGADVADATVRALRECVERDAMARAFCRLAAGRPPRGRLDPAALGAAVVELVLRVEAAGLKVVLRDVTGEVPSPTVLAVVWEELPDGRWTHEGIACRAEAAAAAEAALLEALQARVTDIQGAREDLGDAPLADAHPWYYAEGEPVVASPAPVEDGLAPLVRAVLDLGLPSPACVRLGPDGGPGAVVRVVAPGLECCALDPTRIGPRARVWLTT